MSRVHLSTVRLWGKGPAVDASSEELALLDGLSLRLELVNIPIRPHRSPV